METIMFIIAGMFIILAILLVLENKNHQNFRGFIAVSLWLVILACIAGYLGYLL